jgi:hypothetical protein
MDHKNLMYWKEPKKLTGRIVRWHEKLQDYNFKIMHITEKHNSPADALSRMHQKDKKEEPKLTPLISPDTFLNIFEARDPMLRSDPTPTFSYTALFTYTPTYKTPNIWDCITVVSDFPETIPTHPLDILPRVTPKHITLRSLLRPWPYTSHHFTMFHPLHTDGDPTELRLTARIHETHAHTLEHSTFCREHVCPTHYPYGGNCLAR